MARRQSGRSVKRPPTHKELVDRAAAADQSTPHLKNDGTPVKVKSKPDHAGEAERNRKRVKKKVAKKAKVAMRGLAATLPTVKKLLCAMVRMGPGVCLGLS